MRVFCANKKSFLEGNEEFFIGIEEPSFAEEMGVGRGFEREKFF